MNKIFTSQTLSRWLIMLILLIIGVTDGLAQNVTISPQNGSMICALTSGSQQTQLGFQIGAFGTWRHNQLSLTMTGSNYDTRTEDGQLSQHSNHFITGDNCEFSPADDTRTPSRYIVADWGGSALNTGYITIALPKGYRFTGYTFHLSHDVSKFGKNNTAFDLTTDTRVYMTETNNDFSGNLNRVTLEGNSKEVKEFTRTGDDMGNILYFTTSAYRDGFYALTFRYIELKFTANADASVSLLPSTQTTTGHSLMEIPFSTGKVDLGEIKQGTYQGAQRVSYQYNSVSDMSANMLLYEYESTKTGTALDGTQGLVAYNKAGSITTSGQYFKFAPSSDIAEQKYVLETPVSATMSNTKENPVQFRITEATINYSVESSNTFHITFTDDNDIKYYLGANGNFSTTDQAVWSIDDEGHISSGNSYLYGTRDFVTVTEWEYYATTYSIVNGAIRYRTNSGGYRYLKVYQDYYGGYYPYMTNSNNYTTASIEYIADETQSGAEIYIYDKEGKTKKTVAISGEGTETLYDLNNDAIIFGVKGGKVALVNFKLKLQALNPYIDQMTVVLNDNYNGKNIRQTRAFTADDFSVGGGTFRFYLPTDCVNDHLTITFEDLYSKYGDETYDHTDKLGNSNSRYNFVMSQHHQVFSNDNIYNGKQEAASGTLESVRIAALEGVGQNVRTKVGTVGNIAFRFNNADQLATNDGYLTEYPFTVANYKKQDGTVQQNGTTTTAKGNFITAEFEPTNVQTELHDKTFYVFTTDETRYNIAPTTATQHRFYAFYAMKVEVLCQNYDPKVEFVKVYDKTLTQADNGGVDELPFYGVVVTAPEGVETPNASDVATYKAISEAVKKGDDKTVPKTLKQILYVDLSSLSGVYHSNATGDYALASFDKLREKLAPNALMFLPINTTDKFDNFAYAKKGEVAGSFQSANNIILTDKSPFFSPYTIQVDAANYATYKRLRTNSNGGGLVTKATIVMPFTLNVTNGKHTNEAGVPGEGFVFNLRNLVKLSTQTTAQYGDGYFELINGEKTDANRPYMVEVLSDNGSDYSFIATQKGSNIIATPGTTFEGEKVDGLTNTGTYSGVKVPKGNNIYYFNKDKYVCSSNLSESKPNVYVQPFRAYYNPSGTGAKVTMFNILYDELGNDYGFATDITTVRSRGPLSVSTGRGFMSLTTDEDISVSVYNMQGTMIANMLLRAGERQDINVPAGVYVVNKNKVIVK